jgi:carboxypeptidase Taq
MRARPSAYERLEAAFDRAAVLRSVHGLLGWDSYVALPVGATMARGRQNAALLAVIDEALAAPELPDLIEEAEASEADPWRRANLREMRRDLTLRAATPVALSARLAEAASGCEMAWREAKAAADFSKVRTSFEATVAAARALARARGQALGLTAFDALIEPFDPGVRSQTLLGRMESAAAELAPLRAVGRANGASADFQTRVLQPDALLSAARAVATLLHYDDAAGRLDACAQPFFMDDNPEDVRIGLRLTPGPVIPMVLGLIHEIGHARHERGGPVAFRRQPVGRPRSAAIQESQALILQDIVGRSEVFWHRAGPAICSALDLPPSFLPPDAVADSLTRIGPSATRTMGDEISYALHIILRCRIERALIEGDIEVVDLPAAWNAEAERLFGAPPVDDAMGCLQDIHWYRALFGYFPSYAMGQWAAASFVQAAEHKHPDFWSAPSGLDELAAWLRQNVHAHGSSLPVEALMMEATGGPLGPGAFLARVARVYG